MALTHYSFTALIDADSAGQNIVAAQAVAVNIKGGALANIFSDDAGLNPITQPGAVTDANGIFSFYVNNGTYTISSAGLSEEISVNDFLSYSTEELTTATMAADTKKTYLVGDVINTGEFSTGNGGAGTYDCVVVGTTANVDLPNLFDIIVSTIDANKCFRVRRDIPLQVEKVGVVGDGTTNNDAAVLNAKAMLRTNGVDIIDEIGGTVITAYTSGTLLFGKGVFLMSPDVLEIYQDLGLTLKGQGSRRTNNAIYGATTLLFNGTSSGFCIQAKRNGGRGLHIEDIDVCYNDANFTGDIFDVYGAQGATLTRVFLGNYGITAATRLRTARSIVRTTYDEFVNFTDVVCDGAIDGWWSDDVRDSNGNTFGGSATTFDNVVFYDISGSMIKALGNRTRLGVDIRGVVFNPINIDCIKGLEVNNIDALNVSSSIFTPSTTKKATSGWLDVANCTGRIVGNVFNDLATAGTLNGNLDFSNNKLFTIDGVILTGGVITGKGNEFATSTTGYSLVPVSPLTVDIGPDIFKAPVTTSYSVTPDSASLGGTITYSPEQDASSAKFVSATNRVTIKGSDERFITTSSLPATGSTFQTGRTYNVTVAGTFTLPTPVPGTKLTVHKQTSNALTIAATGGSSMLVGETGSRTSAIATTAETGAMIEFSAFTSTLWIGKTLSGTWTFT